jgi:hypothetical protein
MAPRVPGAQLEKNGGNGMKTNTEKGPYFMKVTGIGRAHGGLAPEKTPVHPWTEGRSRAAMKFMFVSENNSESDS